MEKNKRSPYENWSLKQDDDHILWLAINRKDSAANTLNEEVLDELDDILDTLQHHSPIKALIIYSGKSSGFIAGADITFFKSFTDSEDVVAFIQKGQAIFDKIERLPFTTIAMIEGFCLGGGLELALACQYRIAEDSPKTKIGLPEVKLGIHPGWGGTLRLPQKTGIFAAMDLILSGRLLSAKAAQKMGVINEAVPKRLLERAARDYAMNPPSDQKLWLTYLNKVTNVPFIRKGLGKFFTYQLNKKVKEKHYPAPFKVVDNWVEVGDSHDKALQLEADSIGRLVMNDSQRNLLHVFFLQDQLKGLGKGTNFKPKRVHVVGAGVMGGDIAAWCALKGFTVTLQDQTPTLLTKAMKRAYELGEKQLKEKYLVQRMMDRMIPDIHGDGIAHADVIIEAITEKLSAKQQLFASIEKIAKHDAILATNTSTIPLEEIGQALEQPDRLVGIHFFNPVPKMPLVEVVYGKNTQKTQFNHAMAFVHQIDKLPLPVKSSPGFLVNRILLPYMLEAITLLDEGNSPEVVDQAALDFGMPMGPVEVADTVGLDVCLAALQKLQGELKGTVLQKLEEKIQKGELGRKTGKGFYTYKDGKAIKNKTTVTVPAEVTNRLVLRLLNEAVACLREGIVVNADLLDAGCIFGFGFPPFRGGPITYVRYQGEERLVKMLEEFQARYGNRFSADEGWKSEELCA